MHTAFQKIFLISTPLILMACSNGEPNQSVPESITNPCSEWPEFQADSRTFIYGSLEGSEPIYREAVVGTTVAGYQTSLELETLFEEESHEDGTVYVNGFRKKVGVGLLDERIDSIFHRHLVESGEDEIIGSPVRAVVGADLTPWKALKVGETAKILVRQISYNDAGGDNRTDQDSYQATLLGCETVDVQGETFDARRYDLEYEIDIFNKGVRIERAYRKVVLVDPVSTRILEYKVINSDGAVTSGAKLVGFEEATG